MTVTHRTLDGGWAECETPERCELKFHFPDMSVAYMQSLPLAMMIHLLEVMDPPDKIQQNGRKMWLVPKVEGRVIFDFHRDYDLPATISPEGTMEWWTDGKLHRDGGKPAIIYSDGSSEYWVQGKQKHFWKTPADVERITRT